MRLAVLIITVTLSVIVEGKAKNSQQTNSEEGSRIHVPLGRRLADALAEENGHITHQNPHHGAPKARRRFEIEADDDTAPHGYTSLFVEEVHQMAVTPQTTYTFHKDRDFNQDRIKDISILASNPMEHEGITIVSIDKSTGEVKGLQRGLTGVTHQISHDFESDKLRIRRSLGEAIDKKDWTCDAVHTHHDDIPKRTRDHFVAEDKPWDHNHDEFQSSSNEKAETGRVHMSDTANGGWIQPTKYAFNVDLSIDIDSTFIRKQGSPEAAVEYINFLVSAANVVFEHEVDAHLNIVSITEQEFYDDLTTTKDALREIRLHPRPNLDKNSKMILHHALLGRWVGGGVAFIDSICDEHWGWGVTSDISGRLENVDELVLFDFFIVIIFYNVY